MQTSITTRREFLFLGTVVPLTGMAFARAEAHGGMVFAYREELARTHIAGNVDRLMVIRYHPNRPEAPTTYVRSRQAPGRAGVLASADGAAWEIAGENANLLAFGAVADGDSDQPTDNRGAINTAFEWLAAQRYRSLAVPVGVFATSGAHQVPDFSRIYGQGLFRTLVTGATATQRKCPLILGYWHPSHVAQRPTGSDVEFKSAIDAFEIREALQVDARSVRLARAEDAARFKPGEIYYLRSRDFILASWGGTDMQIPRENTIVRVVAASPSTGQVALEHPVGFSADDGGFLCTVKPNVVEFGLTVGFAQGVSIDGIGIDGYNFFGQSGAYDCHLTNLHGTVDFILQTNAFAYSSLRGFDGVFRQAAVEAKFCSHDSTISNINGRYAGPGVKSSVGLISFGEGARNVTVSDFVLDAESWNNLQVFQIQSARNCVCVRGKIDAPEAVSNPIYFFSASAASAPVECVLEDITLMHAAKSTLVFGAGPNEPESCRVTKLVATTRVDEPVFAVAMQGGSRNLVENCILPGSVYFGPSAHDNILRGNTLSRPQIEGEGKQTNTVL